MAKAEPATIKNVVRTTAELHKFQLLRGRAEGLLDVDVIDLSAFLESGTSAPSRALPALRWFVKHAGVAWSVGELIAPDRVRRAAYGEKKAVAALPWMASRLEEKIVAAQGASDPLWIPSLRAWLAAFGCIRFGHLERSVVERISQSTVHCDCKKGKHDPKWNAFTRAFQE